MASAQAADVRFNNAGSGDGWMNPANWMGGVVPVAGDNALFNFGGQVGRLTTTASVSALRIGVDSPGGLIIDGGSLTTSGGYNAIGTNRVGSLTIQNGGSFSNNDWLSVGFNNTNGCSLTLDHGTLYTSGGFFHNLYFNTAGSATDTRTTLKTGSFLSAGFMDLKSGVMDIAGGALVVRQNVANLIKSYIADGRMIAMGGAAGWIPKVTLGANNWTTVVAGLIPTAPVRWRVIPADPAYPTRDVVVAATTLTDLGFASPLPADPANQDCTATFQEAIEAVDLAGGGCVFVPAGEYRIDGRLDIPTGVSLRGRWTKPLSGEPISGTILKAYAGRNDENSAPFIGLRGDSAVRELAIWYPEQMPEAIVPYSPAIQALNGGGHVVENVTFVNPYIGFTNYQLYGSMGGGDSVRGLYGTPLMTGLEFDQMAEVGRVETVDFSPGYWKGSGLANAPTADEHVAWIRANGTGVITRRIDWSYFAYVTVDGYQNGLTCSTTRDAGSTSSTNGEYYNFHLKNCSTGVHLENFSGAGVQFTRFDIENAEIGVLADANQGSDTAIFQSCVIDSSGWALRSLGSSIFLLQRCDFVSKGIKVDSAGELSVLDCDFGATIGNHLELGISVQASLVGNRFAGGKKIYNNSLRVVYEDDQALELEDVPAYAFGKPERDFKPTSDQLYIVTEAPYNAAADGVTDDTIAFQSALAAAASTGGMVMAPAGNYRLEGNLIVPTGVELRGACDFPHGPRALGTVLYVIGGRNQEDGTPFIQIQPNAGIRGLNFHYPEQIYDDANLDGGMVPYPFMVRGLGTNVHVIDIGVTIPWQLLDLASVRCDNHYVDAFFGTALKSGIVVGSGSLGGQIQNCLFNPSSYAHSSSYYDSIPSGISFPKIYSLVNRQAKGYVLGNVMAEVFHHNFVFGGINGVTLKEEDGKGPQGWALGLGVDQCTTSLQIDALGSGGFDCINNQLVTVDGTNGHYIATGTGLFGTARLFGVACWGRSAESVQVNGGQLDLHSFLNNAPGTVTYDVNGSGQLRCLGAAVLNPATIFLDQEPGTAVEIVGVIANAPAAQMSKSAADLSAVGNLCRSAGTPTPPAGPTGLVVTGNSLNWNDNLESDFNNYNVYRATSVVGDFVQIASRLTVSNSIDTSAVDGESYYYQITAVDTSSAESGAYVTPVKLGRTGWVATASVGVNPGKAIDGNIGTRWDTNGKQAAGQWFKVDMGVPHTFSNLLLDAGASGNDYPRDYEVHVSSDGINWGSPVTTGVGYSAQTVISFPAQTARYIRVTQTGSTDFNYWSIHEFDVVDYAPLAPVTVIATPGPEEAAVAWSASAGAASYSVKRSNTSGGPYTEIANPTVPRFTDTGLTNSITYYYVVTAMNALGESSDSPQADAIPDGTTYQIWARGWGVDIGAETDDYDGDLRSNLYEYALNGNPVNAADAGVAPTLESVGGILQYCHIRRNSDDSLAYTVEACPDLKTWAPAELRVLGADSPGVGFDTVTFEVLTAGSKKFIRLKITQP